MIKALAKRDSKKVGLLIIMAALGKGTLSNSTIPILDSMLTHLGKYLYDREVPNELPNITY